VSEYDLIDIQQGAFVGGNAVISPGNKMAISNKQVGPGAGCMQAAWMTYSRFCALMPQLYLQNHICVWLLLHVGVKHPDKVANCKHSCCLSDLQVSGSKQPCSLC
jgi:hypothetical protein